MTSLAWNFPIRRPHAGPVLGNGTQGIMCHGGGRELHLTVGHAGFWDHRGGGAFTFAATYAEVRRLLEAGDEPGLRALFGAEAGDGGTRPAARPHQNGGGSVVLTLPEGWSLVRAELDLHAAVLAVVVRDDAGDVRAWQIHQAVRDEIAWVEGPGVDPCDVDLVPAWDRVGAELAAIGCAPPERWRDGDELGFVQSLPEDRGLAIAVRGDLGDRIAIASAVADHPREVAERALDADHETARAEAATWWGTYWEKLPEVRLPDPVLQEHYDYGLYRQGCCTPPHGPACTLQGPFLEDYQLPPWSADYHFNVNIEMIYQPALATGCADHLAPLWKLVDGWRERLAANGRAFFGDRQALMLPHAVDDRCQVVGTFWTGTIDHACTAWMALLAWWQYRYTGDEEHLRATAWPLLRGAFAGYHAMAEEGGDGKLRLPVSVSPEYRGSAIDAWGANASFQLAAWHAVTRALHAAAEVLGEEPDPRWDAVAATLPPYAVVEAPHTREHGAHGGRVARIGLWEGQDLDDSHRHHSHLGAIFPFATVDPREDAHRDVVAESIAHWVRTGPGAWSGWCVPWAAAICARCGMADAALAWLHHYLRVFVNEGRGTLHNAAYPGVSTIADGGAFDEPTYAKASRAQREIMQLDAGFGYLTAIHELLAHETPDGAIHVLPALPRDWRDLAFDGLHVPGGFAVGASVRDGRRDEVRVRALRAGRLRLAHHLGAGATCDGEPCESVCDRDLAAGATLVLRAAPVGTG